MQLNPNIMHFHIFTFILSMLKPLRRKENYVEINITREDLVV
jgi:hypothetical protein